MWYLRSAWYLSAVQSGHHPLLPLKQFVRRQKAPDHRSPTLFYVFSTRLARVFFCFLRLTGSYSQRHVCADRNRRDQMNKIAPANARGQRSGSHLPPDFRPTPQLAKEEGNATSQCSPTASISQPVLSGRVDARTPQPPTPRPSQGARRSLRKTKSTLESSPRVLPLATLCTTLCDRRAGRVDAPSRNSPVATTATT